MTMQTANNIALDYNSPVMVVPVSDGDDACCRVKQHRGKYSYFLWDIDLEEDYAVTSFYLLGFINSIRVKHFAVTGIDSTGKNTSCYSTPDYRDYLGLHVGIKKNKFNVYRFSNDTYLFNETICCDDVMVAKKIRIAGWSSGTSTICEARFISEHREGLIGNGTPNIDNSSDDDVHFTVIIFTAILAGIIIVFGLLGWAITFSLHRKCRNNKKQPIKSRYLTPSNGVAQGRNTTDPSPGSITLDNTSSEAPDMAQSFGHPMHQISGSYVEPNSPTASRRVTDDAASPVRRNVQAMSNFTRELATRIRRSVQRSSTVILY